MVTYGKTLGGGLPVGVVCGRADLMKRFREDRPADICFARGTFNSNPYVMGAMDQFLTRLDQPDIAGLYDGLDERWNERAPRSTNGLAAANLPVRVANLSSIWTVLYTKPSRYNWMLQYYLRAHGLALSWTGSGRLIFSLNYHDEEFEAVADRFVVAASEMERDGWFWTEPAATNKAVKRTLFKRCLRTASRNSAGAAGFRLPPRCLPEHRPGRRPAGAGRASGRSVLPGVNSTALCSTVSRHGTIGQNLRRPDEAGLDIPDDEQLDGSRQQAANAERQPYLAGLPDEVGHRVIGLEDAKQRRVDQQHQGRRCPNRHQDDLALQIVADLDLFLVLVAGVVDVVVAARFERKNARLVATSSKSAIRLERRRRDR